jgi:DNA-binding NarL/FixJ family response regulator
MEKIDYDYLLDNKGGKPLTEREYEVLKFVVMGKSNTEIADELFISVHTAKAHVCSILQKMSVNDRVQAAVKAVREDIV